MDQLPPCCLDRTFVSEDGELSFLVIRETGRDGRSTLQTKVREGPEGPTLLDWSLTRWHPRGDDPLHPFRRLDRLDVEMGPDGFGELYQLLFARPNPGDEGFRWIPLEANTPLEDIRVFSDWGSALYATDHEWDDGWWNTPTRFHARIDDY